MQRRKAFSFQLFLKVLPNIMIREKNSSGRHFDYSMFLGVWKSNVHRLFFFVGAHYCLSYSFEIWKCLIWLVRDVISQILTAKSVGKLKLLENATSVFGNIITLRPSISCQLCCCSFEIMFSPSLSLTVGDPDIDVKDIYHSVPWTGLRHSWCDCVCFHFPSCHLFFL